MWRLALIAALGVWMTSGCVPAFSLFDRLSLSPEDLDAYADADPYRPKHDPAAPTGRSPAPVFDEDTPRQVRTRTAPRTGLDRAIADAMLGELSWSENVACAARERGRLRRVGRRGSQDERAWIYARCGAFGVVDPVFLDVTELDVDEMVGLLRHKTESTATRRDGFGQFATAEVEDRRYLLLIGREFDIEPIEMEVPGRSMVTIQGRMRYARGRSLYGTVAFGLLGAARCLVDPLVEAPHFRLLCPVDPGGESRITVGYRLGGANQRYYGDSFYVRSSGYLSMVERSPDGLLALLPRGRPVEVATLLEGINAVRDMKGLPHVRLHANQTAAQDRVTNALLQQYGTDYTSYQEIALGLELGWNIEFPFWTSDIRRVFVAEGEDSAEAVSRLLRIGSARRGLLQPATMTVALTQREVEGGTYFAIAWYQSAEGFDADVATSEAYTAFFAQRRALGRPPGRRLAPSVQASLRQTAVDVSTGRARPHRAWHRTSMRIQRRYTGAKIWTTLWTDTRELQFLPELMAAENVAVGMAVTEVEEPGSMKRHRILTVVFHDVVESETPRINERSFTAERSGPESPPNANEPAADGMAAEGHATPEHTVRHMRNTAGTASSATPD